MRRYTNLLIAVVVGIVAAFAPDWAHAAPALLFAGDTTATAGASGINEAMKVWFNEPVFNNVVSDSEFLQYFEEDNRVKSEESTGGRYIETAQYFQLPAGVGARAEGEYYPIPDAPVFRNSRVGLKKVLGALEMTGEVFRRVKGGRGAFVDWADRAMPDLVERLVNELDRMALGYGNGAKARINGALAGSVITIDSGFGIAGLEHAFLNFLEGERIVFSAAADGDPIKNAGANQAAKIVDLTQEAAGGTLTVTGDAGLLAALADNDFIFLGDAAGVSTQTATGENREFMGLLGMVDDGSILPVFQGLTRADYRLWNSVVVDGSDAALGFDGTLSEDLLVYSDHETQIKGGGKIDMIVTSHSGSRSYWKSLKGDRAINDPRGQFAGGLRKEGGLRVWLDDREVMLKVCRKLPPQLTFGLTLSTFKRWTLGGWQWDDVDGSIWSRVTDGTGRKDAYYAVGFLEKELGCLAPRKNFVIRNLSRVA